MDDDGFVVVVVGRVDVVVEVGRVVDVVEVDGRVVDVVEVDVVVVVGRVVEVVDVDVVVVVVIVVVVVGRVVDVVVPPGIDVDVVVVGTVDVVVVVVIVVVVVVGRVVDVEEVDVELVVLERVVDVVEVGPVSTGLNTSAIVNPAARDGSSSSKAGRKKMLPMSLSNSLQPGISSGMSSMLRPRWVTVARPVVRLYATPPASAVVSENAIGPTGQSSTPPSKSSPRAVIRNVRVPFNVTMPLVGSTLPVNALSARGCTLKLSSGKSSLSNALSLNLRFAFGIVNAPAAVTVPAAAELRVSALMSWNAV